MYDSHIYCKSYREIKELLDDYIEGEDRVCSLEDIETRVQSLYDDGEMSSGQYDDLMSYISDFK